MNTTGIEWTDKSWNPVTGCKHGCEYCYAKAISHRFKKSWEPMFYESRIRQPLKENRSKKIFVCSMADLFGNWVPTGWIERVLHICKLSKQHTFQFLTKNPERLLDFKFPKNCWIGASATNQRQYDRAVNVLERIGDHVTFLSCEPLLEHIKPSKPVDWLIIGACSYPKASQPEKEWALELMDFADAHGIPVFLKPNLKVIPANRKEFPVCSVESQTVLF